MNKLLLILIISSLGSWDASANRFYDLPSEVKQTYQDGSFSSLRCAYQGRVGFSEIEHCEFSIGDSSTNKTFRFNPSKDGYGSVFLKHWVDESPSKALTSRLFTVTFASNCTDEDLNKISAKEAERYVSYVECKVDYAVQDGVIFHVGTSITFQSTTVDIDEYRVIRKLNPEGFYNLPMRKNASNAHETP